MQWPTVRLAIVGIVAILSTGLQLVFFALFTLLKPIIGESRMYYAKSYIMVLSLLYSINQQGEWLRFIRFLISDFKLILTGDVELLNSTKDKRSFYIQNHQTELDWIFMSYFLQMFGREADFSAVMKGSLGYIYYTKLIIAKSRLQDSLSKIWACVFLTVIGNLIRPILRVS